MGYDVYYCCYDILSGFVKKGMVNVLSKVCRYSNSNRCSIIIFDYNFMRSAISIIIIITILYKGSS